MRKEDESMGKYLVMALTDTAATGLLNDAMKTAMADAFKGIQTDVFSVITTALPIGAGIAGVFIAIGLGFRFFRSIAN